MNNRKAFLENAGQFLALSAASPFFGATTFAPIASDRYGAGKFALEIDGVMAGWLRKAVGGALVVEPPSKTQTKATPAPVKAEPIAVECETGMSKAFYDWLKAAFSTGGTRKNGAIIATDYDYHVTSRLEFSNAMLTDVTFPALDAASKDAAFLSFKINPEQLRRVVPAGSSTKIAADAGAQKHWLPSNFKLSIPAVDCKYVSKIEGIRIGGPQSLIATFAESHQADFVQWLKAGGSKSATLEYLEPNLQAAFFTLTFGSVALTKLEPEKILGAANAIKRVMVTLSYKDVALTQVPA